MEHRAPGLGHFVSESRKLRGARVQSSLSASLLLGSLRAGRVTKQCQAGC